MGWGAALPVGTMDDAVAQLPYRPVEQRLLSAGPAWSSTASALAGSAPGRLRARRRRAKRAKSRPQGVAACPAATA